MKNSFIGLGVAGNFTKHLEQAGEAGDFAAVIPDSTEAPKGIFPWYVPNALGHLGVNPLSTSRLDIPADIPVQAEPEVVLICDIIYEAGKVTKLTPTSFGAFNDASLRIAQPKISAKKNWGENSHGMSAHTLPLDSFTENGSLHHFMLASWIKRDGDWQSYGEASEVRYYSYFYQQLIGWLISKMNTQHDHGPLENIADLLAIADYPPQAYVAVGATRYTPFGETTYLADRDEIVIALFDENFASAEVISRLERGELQQDNDCVYLHQRVHQIG